MLGGYYLWFKCQNKNSGILTFPEKNISFILHQVVIILWSVYAEYILQCKYLIFYYCAITFWS